MSGRHPVTRIALLALAVFLPGAAAGQDACGADGWAGLSVSWTRSEVADGSDLPAVEVGLAGAGALAAFRLAGEGGVVLDEGPGRRLFGRVGLGRRLVDVGGVALCAAALGGVALASADAGDALSLGGGLAVTALLPRPVGAGRITPYAALRLLGATTFGEVLGESVGSSGASIGGAAGVAFAAGRLAASLGVTADGFDPGLGATPYPDLAIRLTAGWRF